jgi:molybdopterin synthase sulfur carrier subunit
VTDTEAAGSQASPEVVLRLFAAARQAAGTGRAVIRAMTAGEAMALACSTYGPRFAAVAATSRLWVNGEEVSPGTVLAAGDEVAILPPVSGGADTVRFSFSDFSPSRPPPVRPRYHP